MYALSNVLREGPNVSKKTERDTGIPVSFLSGMLIIVIIALGMAGMMCIHHRKHQLKKGEGWTLTK